MIPIDRVRAMLRLGSDAAQESWTWRYDDADGCRVIENPRARFEEERRIAEMCASSDADAALIAAAPDLARDVLTLADALATAERERDAAATREAIVCCPECDGGTVIVRVGHGFEASAFEPQSCDECGGTGRVTWARMAALCIARGERLARVGRVETVDEGTVF